MEIEKTNKCWKLSLTRVGIEKWISNLTEEKLRVALNEAGYFENDLGN